MKGLLLALAFLPALALAKEDCLQRCSATLSKCQGTCGAAMSCGRRCTNQFDSCIATCEQTSKMERQPLPERCPGPKGKMIPCTEYTKTDTRPTKKQVEMEERIKKETAAHGGNKQQQGDPP